MGLSTTIPSIAIKKLIPVLQTQVMQLIDITSLIEIAVNSLPLNIKCNDPKIQNIKQQLENVQLLLLNINKIKDAMGKLSQSFNIISGIAATVEVVQLAIPAVPGVPQGPFAKLANIASTLDKNCKSAAKCLASILASIDLATSKLDSVVAFAIIKLTSICSNQTFAVNANVQTEILKLTEQSKTPLDGQTTETAAEGKYTSKFYNKYNVSQEDLDSLDTIIFDLNELELKVADYLQEAPSKVYSGNTPPDNALGKIGDFYNDLLNREIYGPKPLDSVWLGKNNTPIKY